MRGMAAENRSTLLVVSSETADKDSGDIMTRVLNQSSDIHIIMTSSLPLRDITVPTIDHITFIVDLTSYESYQLILDSLPRIEVDHFHKGNISVICINAEKAASRAVCISEINELVCKYNMTSLFVNIQDDKSCEFATERLILMVRTSAREVEGLYPVKVGSQKSADTTMQLSDTLQNTSLKT